jgi:phage terminase small subunit
LTFLTEENMAVRKRASKIDGKPKETRGRPPVTTASPLTRKQELFVKEIVSKDGQITLREAAVNAGYSVGSAHTRAYELTNPHISPHVVAAIQAYRRELDEKYGVTYQRHLRDLQQIRDTALQNGAYSAAVQAEYRRGQAQGDIYVSKSEIRHGSIDSMSKDEVLKALEEIKNSYAPVTIDITPEENASNRDKARGRLLQASEGSSAEVETEAAFDED